MVFRRELRRTVPGAGVDLDAKENDGVRPALRSGERDVFGDVEAAAARFVHKQLSRHRQFQRD